ncbi:MAG: hypothetical protein A6F72_02645 [Cycloclasticus sp. symbiont of Poecilosclerida sp. N]|nr:MAG: hypothetical protein A6F72_02645 [Cycloclasticus sp. symbiont of Poecilosclerida sp. N]
MNIQASFLKLSCVVLVPFVVAACSYAPSIDGVFIDQKEAYKKAHELPPLEMPPELSIELVKDEYDGGVGDTVAALSKDAVVQTTPLPGGFPDVEIIERTDSRYLLVHDSLRNTWRKTVSALEALNYDIEDKNRARNEVYLNITPTTKEADISWNLFFWEKAETTLHVVTLYPLENGVVVRVLDKEKNRIENAVSKEILTGLFTELTP